MYLWVWAERWPDASSVPNAISCRFSPVVTFCGAPECFAWNSLSSSSSIFIRLLLWRKPTKSNYADCEVQCFLRNLRGAKTRLQLDSLLHSHHGEETACKLPLCINYHLLPYLPFFSLPSFFPHWVVLLFLCGEGTVIWCLFVANTEGFPHEMKKRLAQPKRVDPQGPDQAGVCFFDSFSLLSHWWLRMAVGSN